MRRILVIDDDSSVGAAIKAVLLNNDFAVVLTNNSRLGTDAFDTDPFDLVMVDIFMPEPEGLETVRYVRTRAPTIPIIAMSGFRFRSTIVPTFDFLEMAAALGATCCLRKPFAPEQMMAAVNSCMAPDSRGSPAAAREHT
jgi:DNA-binding response OmpR family regulator